MSREATIQAFDPNGLGLANGNLFGLPFTPEEAQLIIIPVPWEVTVSYSQGTAQAPQAILAASLQVDLFDSETPDAWKMGVAMLPIDQNILQKSHDFREKAKDIIDALMEGETEESLKSELEAVNRACTELKVWVKIQAKKWLAQGKKVALLGGDHSTPLGLICALSERNENFGVLHIDAHCDLRESYEGFKYSHASIMYNALKMPELTKLVQVGIRDFCETEYLLAQHSNERIMIFEHRAMLKDRFRGRSWDEICDEIISNLPQDVYVSFDIDGLDPSLCPSTGTPVPGGLRFEEAMYLVEKVVETGRKIIGFDLNEVGTGTEWDANVGARVLFRLCNYLGKSQGLI